MERFILIDAQSALLSIKEVVEEKKSAKRLTQIKDMHEWFVLHNKAMHGANKDCPLIPSTLKVITGLHNPPLFR